jgi:hypothetical protein
MDHGLLADIYRAARQYHGALAHYAAAMRSGSDIEDAAQSIVGTSLRYRLAIDHLLARDDAESLNMVASRGRLERLRRVLYSASRRYNLQKRPAPRPVRSAQAGFRRFAEAHVAAANVYPDAVTLGVRR